MLLGSFSSSTASTTLSLLQLPLATPQIQQVSIVTGVLAGSSPGMSFPAMAVWALTPCMFLLKNHLVCQVWWCRSVISATQKVEVGELQLEVW
jgi:hypothetical protein